MQMCVDTSVVSKWGRCADMMGRWANVQTTCERPERMLHNTKARATPPTSQISDEMYEDK